MSLLVVFVSMIFITRPFTSASLDNSSFRSASEVDAIAKCKEICTDGDYDIFGYIFDLFYDEDEDDCEYRCNITNIKSSTITHTTMLTRTTPSTTTTTSSTITKATPHDNVIPPFTNQTSINNTTNTTSINGTKAS